MAGQRFEHGASIDYILIFDTFPWTDKSQYQTGEAQTAAYRPESELAGMGYRHGALNRAGTWSVVFVGTMWRESGAC